MILVYYMDASTPQIAHSKMMKRIKLELSFENLVRSKVDSGQILCTYNNVHPKLSERDNASHFSLLLGLATEHDHVELVKNLLTDTRCDLDSSHELVPSPLFVATRSGNVEMFKLFLRSNPDLDMIKSHELMLPSIDYRSFKMSVFEYACFNDSVEIVRHILIYVQKQYDERVARNVSPNGTSAITPVTIHSSCPSPTAAPVSVLRATSSVTMTVPIDPFATYHARLNAAANRGSRSLSTPFSDDLGFPFTLPAPRNIATTSRSLVSFHRTNNRARELYLPYMRPRASTARLMTAATSEVTTAPLNATVASPAASLAATVASPAASLAATVAPPAASLDATVAPPAASLDATVAPPAASLDATVAPPAASIDATVALPDLFLINTDRTRFVPIPPASIQSNPWWHAKRMLHIVMKLCSNNPFTKCSFSLPQIVKLVLDAGADVNVQDENGCIPLYILCKEVKRLQFPEYVEEDVQIKTRMILETAELLLAAGSEVNGTLTRNPLAALFDVILEVWGDLNRPSAYMRTCMIQLSLISSLVNLLLKHGAKRSRVNTGHSFGFVAGHSLVLMVAGTVAEVLMRNINVHDDVMDRMAEMFRCLVLAGRDVYGECGFRGDYVERGELHRTFKSIALYASQPGHSKKLMRLILSTLNVSQVIQLKRRLSFEQSITALAALRPTSSPPASDRSLSCALEWINGVRTPFTLEHLARQAIVRKLTYRCFLDMSSLKLPKLLSDYLLLLDN